MGHIYEEIFTDKIKVQLSTLSIKYFKVKSYRFFKSVTINLLYIIGVIVLLVASNSSCKLK
jgi:hypothetical protein